MKKVVAIALLALAGIAVAGCGSDDGGSNGDAKSAAGGPAITIGIAAPCACLALPQLAAVEGYFTKSGLDNVSVKMIPAAQLLSAVAGGSVQFGAFASPQADLGGLAGSMKWIASWAPHTSSYLLAQPGIESVKDLKGKSVGITTPGSTSALLLSVSLSRAGLGPEDVKTVPLGIGPYVSAFTSGQISAATYGSPLLEAAQASRRGSKIIDNYKTVPYTGGGITANTGYASEHPAETTQVLKALDQALERWFEDPAAAKRVIKEIGSITDPKVVDGSYADSLTIMSKELEPVSEETERNVLALLKSNGYPEADPDNWQKVVDDSYLAEALASK